MAPTRHTADLQEVAGKQLPVLAYHEMFPNLVEPEGSLMGKKGTDARSIPQSRVSSRSMM